MSYLTRRLWYNIIEGKKYLIIESYVLTKFQRIRLSKMKVESADIKKLRVKAKLNDIFRFKLSDKAFIKSMMAEWKSRAFVFSGSSSLQGKIDHGRYCPSFP
jgi:hypothetical protein